MFVEGHWTQPRPTSRKHRYDCARHGGRELVNNNRLNTLLCLSHSRDAISPVEIGEETSCGGPKVCMRLKGKVMMLKFPREFQIFLLGYILVEICEIFTVGGFPLNRNVRIVCGIIPTKEGSWLTHCPRHLRQFISAQSLRRYGCFY